MSQTDDSPELIAKDLEAIAARIDAYLATHRSARIAHARSGLTYLVSTLMDEPRHAAVVAAREARIVTQTQARAQSHVTAPPPDAHDAAMLARLVEQGVLPADATVADFHRWQDERRATMAQSSGVAVPK